MTLTPLTVPPGNSARAATVFGPMARPPPLPGAGARRERPCLARSGGVPTRDDRRARHGADRDERRRRAAARPEPGHRGPLGDGCPARPAADRARLRDPRPRALAGRCAVAISGASARVLRDLLGLPQPQERRPAAAPGRALRPPARATSTAACSAATTRPQSCTTCSARASPRTPSRSSTMLFFVFIRVARVRAGVSPRPAAGLFFATALSLNWLLAAGQLPAAAVARPVLRRPGELRGPAATGVSHLQTALLNQRLDFLRDPAVAGSAQSIGAFASLHVSIFFTAALATHLLGACRACERGPGLLLALTVAATSTSAGTTCSTTSPAS